MFSRIKNGTFNSPSEGGVSVVEGRLVLSLVVVELVVELLNLLLEKSVLVLEIAQLAWKVTLVSRAERNRS